MMKETMKEQVKRALEKGPMHPRQIGSAIGLSRKRVSGVIGDSRGRGEGLFYIHSWMLSNKGRIAVYALGNQEDAMMYDIDEEIEEKTLPTIGNLGKATRCLEDVSALWYGVRPPVVEVKKEAKEKKVAKTRESFVADIIKLSPVDMTRKEIGDALGCSRQNARMVAAIDDLLVQGVLVKTGHKKGYTIAKVGK